MSGEPTPATAVPIRLASSVLLVREVRAAESGVEVFVLHRATGMTFAGGMLAFPGGGVDPSDADPEIAWTGPDPASWARRLGLGSDVAAGRAMPPESEPATARALVVAAVRELYEETGVLLAGEGPVQPIDEDRVALLGRRLGFRELLERRGWPLRSDLLVPWANWITPPGGTRRYDTFFFAAAVPPGQFAELRTDEAEIGEWGKPARLLESTAAGAITMLPPTRAMLRDLATVSTTDEVLTAERVVRPIQPTVLSRPGEAIRVAIDGIEVG